MGDWGRERVGDAALGGGGDGDLGVEMVIWGVEMVIWGVEMRL